MKKKRTLMMIVLFLHDRCRLLFVFEVFRWLTEMIFNHISQSESKKPRRNLLSKYGSRTSVIRLVRAQGAIKVI